MRKRGDRSRIQRSCSARGLTTPPKRPTEGLRHLFSFRSSRREEEGDLRSAVSAGSGDHAPNKRGQTYGQTDDIGYYITENPVDIRDLQATVLHLLGMDPFKLTYNFQGLDQRLIGAEGKANLHPALLA